MISSKGRLYEDMNTSLAIEEYINVMEYVAGGELFDKFVAQRFSDDEVLLPRIPKDLFVLDDTCKSFWLQLMCRLPNFAKFFF
ncbi:hypothetical protein HanRHA438_Chr16g0769781 [Helianthus annuus]|nr:hypothetical protein HanRHA438_Chr16g0769781 [Helianthus annuus]